MNTNDPLQIRRLIQAAFADVPFPFSNVDEEHRRQAEALRQILAPAPSGEQIVSVSDETQDLIYKYNEDLLIFDGDEIQYLLPRLMVHLLDNYPDSEIYMDEVIRYLNVLTSISPARVDIILNPPTGTPTPGASDIIDRLRTGEPYFTRTKLSAIAGFTAEQGHAVIAWLHLMRSWLNSEDDMYRSTLCSEIDSALAFWEPFSNR